MRGERTKAPAGWYMQPGSSVYRWWDGEDWTEQTKAPEPGSASAKGSQLDGWAWLFAAIMPIIGLILGCILLINTRGKNGLGQVVLSVLAFLVWTVLLTARFGVA